MSFSEIIQNALQTPDGTYLISSGTHDYKTHVDKNGKEYMVDGGKDYIRRNMHDDQIDMTVLSQDDFDTARNKLLWGSYGKEGNQLLRYVLLKDMEIDHIEKVIEILENSLDRLPSGVHNHIKYRIEMYERELIYRKS